MTRRLAAILAAEAADSSRLMHEDEEATHAAFVLAMQGVIEPAIQRNHGRMVKSTGDSFLAEFPSALAAVQCGMEFQDAIAAQATSGGRRTRLLFRIGINVGDVIFEERDVHGDHVDLAVRLGQMAEPGGILISGWVYDSVREHLFGHFVDAGERQFRTIARPVRTFRLKRNRAATTSAPDDASRPFTAPSGPLFLSLIGNFSMAFNGREIRLKSLKARAMLGYLVLSERFAETRERLVGLLWSESAEEQARASLRQVIHELRLALVEAGFAGLVVNPREIGFAHGALDADILDVMRAAERGDVHLLLLNRTQITDGLLAGTDDLDPAFRVWLLAKRQGLREKLLRELEDALEGAPPAAQNRARIAQALLNLDPTHEVACRMLMRIRAEAGDVAGALRQYKILWDLLDEEYGMEPATATQELVAAIKQGKFETSDTQPLAPAETARPPEPPAGPGRTTAGRLILLLSPIGLRNVQPDLVPLVEGFRQHLIASLVRFREWSVSDTPLRSPAGTETNADDYYELQTLAYQGPDCVNLVLIMKEAASGMYIWSEGFELKLESWFEAQQRVVRRVATTMNVHLSAERLRRLAASPHLPIGLFDRWLRCQGQILSLDPAQWQHANQECTAIIKAAPQFAPAYSSVAQAHNLVHITHPGVLRTRENERIALDLARIAAQLDPVDPRSQLHLGWAYAMSKQYGQAAIHFNLAYELNPDDSWIPMSSALFHAFDGKPTVARALASKALEAMVAPSRTHWAYLTAIRFLAGDYEGTIPAADAAGNVTNTVLGWRAAAAFHLGRIEEARASAAQFLAALHRQWTVERPADDAAIVGWFLHLYPISHAEDWERLRDGLAGVGLPTGTMRHHDW
jgi:class 3 adenylate cyclase/DNA-binding SARP family transcriptional activator/tetratricopeptide (TPR) repeat protein